MRLDAPREIVFTVVPPPSGQVVYVLLEYVPQPAELLPPHGSKAALRAPKVEKGGRLESAPTQKLYEPYGVIAHYVSLSGNQPNTYGNSVALWNSLQPNLSAPPLASAQMTNNDQIGDLQLGYALQATSYCLTYQTGASMMTMCALVQIPYPYSPPVVFQTITMKITQLTDQMISMNYETLPGYDPLTAKNWIGIWPGWGIPYPPAPGPVAQAKIESPYTLGSISFAFNPTLPQYIIVYFTGSDRTNIASALCISLTLP